VIRRLARFVVGGLAGAFLVDRWLGGLTADEAGRPALDPIRTRVEVDAPIGQTWAVLVDLARQPEWMTDMKSVEIITPGPLRVGSRATATVRILGIAVADPVEVVELGPPHRYGIRHDGVFKGHGLITLDTIDGGRRTRVEWSETLVPPVLPALGGLLQAPILRRIFQADLERFKALAEAGTGTRPAAAWARAADPV
jgi:uncharacterized membrane protein